MIKWNREEVARFLNSMWKYSDEERRSMVITFPIKSGRGELRVSPQTNEIELNLFAGFSENEQMVNWLLICERIDVHADTNETPCVTFWPPTTGMDVFSWLGIYRGGDSFSIFSGTAPGFTSLPTQCAALPELAAF